MKHNKKPFDIIVVGGGHAGIEAAHIAAFRGHSVCLVTMDKKAIGRMSCNPSVGGLAKGQMVREIDILGGLMGRLSDVSGLQYKMLNKSKGRSVWSPRAQIDKRRYESLAVSSITSNKNISIKNGEVVGLSFFSDVLSGAVLRSGDIIRGNAIVITCGTFLSGMIHIGKRKIPAGRMGEAGSSGITEHLAGLGLKTSRLKTGTPPRAYRSSIDWKKTTPLFGDPDPSPFSFQTGAFSPPNEPCHIVKTNSAVHNIIIENIDRSPMYSGDISGVGPRYCPSIEDKVKRFSENPSHHIVIEPEWLGSDQVYINGFSTSLPEEIQIDSLKKIPAFKDIELLRPGYAIEYDFFPPSQLKNTLESKDIPGLFFAGQVNGTSGYEEASAQGLLAGINASCFIKNCSPLILSRDSSYIGVLIDDLVTKDTLEPYRMFTSRAEYRIMLRYSNAEDRLYEFSKNFSLLNQSEKNVISNRLALKKHVKNILLKSVSPSDITVTGLNVKQRSPAKTLLRRPDISIYDLSLDLSHLGSRFSMPNWSVNEALLDVDTEIKYGGYLKRHLREIERMSTNENKRLLPGFNYKKISGLSLEAQEKFSFVRPETVGQAMRISGITPADISVLLIHVSL